MFHRMFTIRYSMEKIVRDLSNAFGGKWEAYRTLR